MFNPTVDIIQNAKNKVILLLNTIPGERIMSNNCQFGVDVVSLLFSSKLDINIIKTRLQTAIRRWVPQISTINISVNRDEYNLIIEISLSIDNKSESIVLEYVINET